MCRTKRQHKRLKMKFDPSVVNQVMYRNYVIPWKKNNIDRCTILVHLPSGTMDTDIQTKVAKDGHTLYILIRRTRVLLSSNHVAHQCRENPRVEKVESFKTAIDKSREPIDSGKATCLRSVMTVDLPYQCDPRPSQSEKHVKPIVIFRTQDENKDMAGQKYQFLFIELVGKKTCFLFSSSN